MITLLFVIIFVLIMSRVGTVDTSMDTVDSIIKETHAYSGIHEPTYSDFFATIQLAKKYRAHPKESQEYLHQAIRKLNDIPLYMTPPEPDVQDDITTLGERLGREFEKILMNIAINTDKAFKPKYI